MAKQTQRQRAKKANAATGAVDQSHINEATIDEATCCLPHCEVPGEKLRCGHCLCGEDFLKLTRFIFPIQKFTIACPMCRKMEILDAWDLQKAVSELPFRCIVVPCACNEPRCDQFAFAFARPCKSHNNYTCEVCKHLGKKGPQLRVSLKDYDDEGETNSHRDVFSEPGWGMPDDAFEGLAQAFREVLPGQAAYLRRVREARRQGQDVPE